MISHRPFLWWLVLILLISLSCTKSGEVTPAGTPQKTAMVPAASTAEITDAAPTPWVMVVCSDGLNIRSKPSPFAPIVGGLVRGETVTVFESLNGWLRVGVGQWVRGSYLHANGGGCLSGSAS